MANRHIKQRKTRNAPHKMRSLAEAIAIAQKSYRKHGTPQTDAINAAEDYVNSHSAAYPGEVERYVQMGYLNRSETSGTLFIQVAT